MNEPKDGVWEDREPVVVEVQARQVGQCQGKSF